MEMREGYCSLYALSRMLRRMPSPSIETVCVKHIKKLFLESLEKASLVDTKSPTETLLNNRVFLEWQDVRSNHRSDFRGYD
jgi:hypothetical protein